MTSAVRKDTTAEQLASAGAALGVLNQQAHVNQELQGQQEPLQEPHAPRQRKTQETSHEHEGEPALQCGYSIAISGKSARCSGRAGLLTRLLANGDASPLTVVEKAGAADSAQGRDARKDTPEPPAKAASTSEAWQTGVFGDSDGASTD